MSNKVFVETIYDSSPLEQVKYQALLAILWLVPPKRPLEE